MTPMETMSISSRFIWKTRPTEDCSGNFERGRSCHFGPRITTHGFIVRC